MYRCSYEKNPQSAPQGIEPRSHDVYLKFPKYIHINILIDMNRVCSNNYSKYSRSRQWQGNERNKSDYGIFQHVLCW